MEMAEKVEKGNATRLWVITRDDPTIRDMVIAKLGERSLPLVERQIYTAHKDPMIIEISREIADEMAEARNSLKGEFTIYWKNKNSTIGWRMWNEGKQHEDPSANFVRKRARQNKNRGMAFLSRP